MRTFSKIIIAIIVLLFLLGVGYFLYSNFGKTLLQKQPVATINNHKFELIIAKSAKEKEIGLSSYKSLPNDKGMLFPFGKDGYYSFWMKDMKFSIDIIFLKNNKIVTIYEKVPVPTKGGSLLIYNPTSPADTVLEINSGLSKKYNLKVGDRVVYENFSG